MTPDTQYEPVIGLEVHAQLLTESKAFCRCSTSFGEEPNSNVCPVCLGLPGVLPVLNVNVVEFVIRMGLATRCAIAERSVFARKNYFYPDLPKGYQISQYEEPICKDGALEIELPDGMKKSIGIARIHMEEDAGKSIHDLDADTLVDVNRCGVPLIEIVSKPDLRSPHEATLFLTRIRQMVTYLGICDGNMEEGSLRCDANVSVRRKGTALGTKTEVKNLNSFRFVEQALQYEIDRQIGLLGDGRPVLQETLLWDPDQGIAVPMRSKEEAHDYRYFPDPDLLPVMVGKEWIKRVRATLPEFPSERRDRYMHKYGLPKYDADILTAEKPLADYFESVIGHLKIKNAETWKIASNWIMTEVLRGVKERHIGVARFPVGPDRFAKMIDLIVDGTISGTIAKDVFEEMLESAEAPRHIVERKGLTQLSDAKAIEDVVDTILAANEEQVRVFLGGKRQVFGYLVGETMKAMKGKANPKLVNEILIKKLDARK